MTTPTRIAVVGGSGAQAWRYLARLDDFSVSVIAPATDSGGNTGFINLFENSDILVSGDLGKLAAAFLPGSGGAARALLLHRIAFAPLRGYTVANLLQIAAFEQTHDQLEALALLNEVFPFTAELMLATLAMPTLCARFDNGAEARYEHVIDRPPRGVRTIQELWVEPQGISVAPRAREALAQADFIVIGPGDVFTSCGAVLVVPGVREAIEKARRRGAKVVCTTNLMTKKGHTGGWGARAHLDTLMDLFKVAPDAALVNEEEVNADAIARYEEEGAAWVRPDVSGVYRGCRIFRGSLVEEVRGAASRPVQDTVPRSYIRHDPAALLALFLTLYRNERCHGAE